MFESKGQTRETVFSIDQQILSMFHGDIISRSKQVNSIEKNFETSNNWHSGKIGSEKLSDICPDCGGRLARTGCCCSCIICGWGGCD